MVNEQEHHVSEDDIRRYQLGVRSWMNAALQMSRKNTGWSKAEDLAEVTAEFLGLDPAQSWLQTMARDLISEEVEE